MTKIIEELAVGPIVFNGAMGTELDKLGVDTTTKLWSAAAIQNAPQAIYDIHYAYFRSGARITDTNTYQATVPGLLAAGYDQATATSLIRKAVLIAKKARDDYASATHTPKGYVGASIGPYGAYLANGAEYTGAYRLSKEQYQEFHAGRLQEIEKVGVDFLALETLPRLDEAIAVLDYIEKKYPKELVWVAFSVKNDQSLADGSSLADAVKAVSQYRQVFAVGVNCIDLHQLTPIIQTVKANTNKAVVVYPNSGERYNPVTKTWDATPDELNFKTETGTWLANGADIIGGCCRTSPQDIAQITQVVTEARLHV